MVSAASVLVSLAATQIFAPAGLTWSSALPATVVPLLIAPFAALWAGNMILALHRSNLRLEHLLLHDPMTGLLNRAAFFDLFQTELSEAGGTVLMLDIDKFKSINDTFGHQVGDEVIKLVTSVIREQSMQYGRVARLGGEEFAIFLPETTIDSGTAQAEAIRRAIETRSFDAGSRSISCTISIGATYRSKSEPIDAALNRADKALYLAKNNGRNRTETVDFTL